ncbi:hypothetical protein [Acuticoccus sediminis]|uniref:hypothetical protein n=1 Tax=Acuticoccus sediminis TaxID=2184697 RepID=UPI001CFE6E9A|nr:hypothetical protein [Acuticoccus sediminis]
MKPALLIALALAVALGACGRRAAPSIPESAENLPRVERFPHDPGSQRVPDRKFILDPILQ